MKLSNIGRFVLALVASAALGLGMTACGGGTVGYLWVIGTQYNQISAFKIDEYTGNLTASPNSPFSSGGVNPQSIVVKTGGRFVYVINSGTATPATPGTSGSIASFSVGGDGVLVYQQTFYTQGTMPIWATTDISGNYLYVLDKYSPAYNGTTDLNGDITAFSINGTTGQLTLVPNAQSATTAGQTQTTYFEVGTSPRQLKVSSSGCIYALSATSLYPYTVNSSNGQLTTTTTGVIPVSNAVNLSSINTGGAAIYLTDATNNTIYPFNGSATACALTPVSPGTVYNIGAGPAGTGTLTSNPIASITANNGKFLYVINQSSTANPLTPANSSISAFTINSNGSLAPLADVSNPYSIGSGPVCVVQDPTSQYLYTSNNQDSTVTGKVINQNTGVLSPLSRGSSFPATGKPTCLAVSGNI
jgi:6-phosphogluconolactonase